MQDTAKKLVYRGENVTKLLGVPKRTLLHMIFFSLMPSIVHKLS